MRLEGKVALISGGARGMGAAEAKLFAREGAKVVIGDVLEAEGRRTESEINEISGECLFVPLDVTKESAWQNAVSAAVELFKMFPDEASARQWFEEARWPDGRVCVKCGSVNTSGVPNDNPMPYWCSDCRSYFSVKFGTVMQGSKLPMRKWAIVIYLVTTNLKGVSSMKLHRDLDIAQKNAWHMLHRIRKAMQGGDPLFRGPVEADETYIGGKEANKHSDKKLRAGRGTVGKTAVVGIKDRETNQITAMPVESVDRSTLQGFVHRHTSADTIVYTDEAAAYVGLRRPHKAVNHSAKEFVDGMAHTNGMESFWAMLKCGYHGVYHQFSVKHLHRYVGEFEGRHNDRPLNTIDQMSEIARGMFGQRLRYQDLIA